MEGSHVKEGAATTKIKGHARQCSVAMFSGRPKTGKPNHNRPTGQGLDVVYLLAVAPSETRVACTSDDR